MSTTALASYRHLLRSINLAFRGDAPLLQRARSDTRTAYEATRTLASDDAGVASKLQHAEEVAKVLRTQVVQGRRREPTADQPDANITQAAGPEQGKDSQFYELRIHPEIELGDNETIRQQKKNPFAGRTRKCGGF